VELGKVGKKIGKQLPVATVESVKIAADVYTPVDCTVKAVNADVSKDPTLINSKPMESWMVEVTCNE